MFENFFSQQAGNVANAQITADDATDKALSLQDEVERLRSRVDRLALVSQAMWELLRERATVTDPQLLAKIREIDLRDGRVDGRMGRKIITCKHCGQTLNSTNRTCLYCGEPLNPPEVFNSV